MTALSLGARRDPLRPPEAPGMGRGVVFALVAHAALLAALSAGVHWQTKTEPAFEAELWSAVPQAAAPREQAPPEPEPTPEPKPVAKPVPPPPPQEDVQVQRDAEIAIAKARDQKKRELEVKRLAELEAERKKQQTLKEQQALKDKQERDKQEREKLERDKRLAEDKKEQQDKLKQDKLKQDKAAKDADAKREAQRQENLRRIQGMAGASGGPGATGTAMQSSGPSATYGGRIKARIRPNIIYTDSGGGNPVAEVEVRAAPDGTIIGKKLVKPSGNTEWDNAVLRAIDKTETLPRDTDGRVPSLLVISFKPGE